MPKQLDGKFFDKISEPCTTFGVTLYVPVFLETSITLLKSPEKDIVLKALQNLVKHANKNPENALDLFDKGALENLHFLLFHEDPLVLQFALNLIAQFVIFNEVLDEYERDSYRPFIKKIRKFYCFSKDVLIQEYSSRILAKLVVRPTIAATLITEESEERLLKNLIATLHDADLVKNNLELLYQLVQDENQARSICNYNEFNVSIFLCFMKSGVDLIRKISAGILNKLSLRPSKLFLEKVRKEEIIPKMIEIILDPEKVEIHMCLLDFISTIVSDEEIAVAFGLSYEFQLLSGWIRSCSEEYYLPVSLIISKLTKIIELRQCFNDNNFEDIIMELFKCNHQLVINNACNSLLNMLSIPESCEMLAKPIILKTLLEIIEKVKHPNVDVSLAILHDFFKRLEITKEMVYSYNGFPIITSSYQQLQSEVSFDTYMRLMDIVYILAMTSAFTDKIMDINLFQFIFDQILKEETSVIAKKAANILICYTTNKELREYFKNINGPKLILQKINIIRNELLLKTVLLYVHNLCAYKDMTFAFLYAGINKELRKVSQEIKAVVPIVDKIIDVTYDLYLPIKFYEKGRLDITDKIVNRFYLIHGKWNDAFPFLEIFEDIEVNPIVPVYVVEFGAPKDLMYEHYLLSNTSLPLSKSGKRTSKASLRKSSKVASDKSLISGNLPSIPEDNSLPLSLVFTVRVPPVANYGRISSDPYLTEYVEKLYYKMYASKYLLCAKHKIKTIARFVVNQLCGVDEYYYAGRKNKYWIERYNLHISALKERLGSSMIPIGFVAIGGSCERALLFKAIADRLVIPSTLVKHDDDAYYNEIVLLPEELGRSIDYAIVDLMHNIGKLYIINSSEANRYCEHLKNDTSPDLETSET